MGLPRRFRWSCGGLAGALVATALVATAPEVSAVELQTRLLSLAVDGAGGNAASPHRADTSTVAVSADGRYVAFTSDADNLLGAGADGNHATDVFRYDRQTGRLVLVSVSDRGAQGDGASGINQIDMSADGNLVVFESLAHLTDHQPPAGRPQVYVRDVAAGRTVLVSATEDSELGSVPLAGGGTRPSISADGRYVAFETANPHGGDVRVVRKALVLDGGLVGGGELREVHHNAVAPSINGDGSRIAFTTSDRLDPLEMDTNHHADVYVWSGDARHPFALVSADAEGRAGDGPSRTSGPRAVSDSGDEVAFLSLAASFVGDPLALPAGATAYIRRFASGVSPVALARSGGIVAADQVSLARTAAFAVFTSSGDPTGAQAGADAGVAQVYLRDLTTSGGDVVVSLVSQSSTGTTGDAGSGAGVVADGGSVVAFASEAGNLHALDANGHRDVFARGPGHGPGIENLALTVEPGSGAPGITRIDLSGVDLATMPLLPRELESSPLRANPLRANPLRANPLRANPLRANPLRANPLRANPLRANPLRAAALPPTPLSDVPLLLPGGWPAVLAGTPFEGVPLQSVLLQDVLDLEGFAQIDALTLEDIDIGSTPLGEVSLQVFLFGGPSLDRLSPAADWCGQLATKGFDCGAAGIDEATSSLVDLAFTGAPVDELVFLPQLPVRAADLEGSPAYSYDVASVDVDATALGDVLVEDLPQGIVDCSDPQRFDCAGAALRDAVAAEQARQPGAPPVILDAPTAVLGRILEREDVAGDLRFADVVRMLVDPAKLAYRDMPLLPLLLGTAVSGQLRYTAAADVSCLDTSFLDLRVTLPTGFRYKPGSAAFTFDGRTFEGDSFFDPEEARAGAGDGLESDSPPGAGPVRSEPASTTLTWRIRGQRCNDGGTVRLALSFLADPWVELGTKTSSVQLITASGQVAQVRDTAAFVVTDAHEDNDTRDRATRIEPGQLVLSHLGAGDTVDHFVVGGPGGTPLERGAIVWAVLSHLPADFDLRLDGPPTAPLRANPLRANPLRANPIEDPGLSTSPDGQVVGPEVVEDVPRHETTLSQSASRALESDVVAAVVNAASAEDGVTLAVTGYLGASSDRPYSLQVFVEPAPQLDCLPQTSFAAAGAPGTLPAVSSLDPDTRTLVLVNEQRFDALHGPGSTQQVRDMLAAAIPAGDAAGPFAVVPVDGDPGVRAAYPAWDANPCEPELANDVVRENVRVSDAYVSALPQLRFMLLIGDDNVLPSYRVPDATTLANQREYYPDLVLGEHDNPLSAAAAYGYVLSDNAYTQRTAIPWLDHELLVGELAGGRLVESLEEILGTIARYREVKYVDVGSSLLATYDFLRDGGQDTHELLETVVTGEARSLISDDWTKADLLDAELSRGPAIAGVWGHYDHSRLLTAAGDRMPNPQDEIADSREALAAGLAAGTLYFTVGCNAGINVPALAWVGGEPDDDRLLDWAQVVSRVGGALYAHSGYGYGDDVISAYSERLMTLFAGFLADKSMAVGQAAVAARHAFLSEAALDVYTDKVVASSTFYGLPFVRVGPDGGVAAPPDARPRPPAQTAPPARDPLTGLQASAFDVAPQFDAVDTGRGRYHVARLADAQEPTLHALYRPVQPAVSLDLPAAPGGLEVGDLLVTDLTSVDTPLPDPVFVRPTVDLTANEPEPTVRDVAYPVSLGGVTQAGNLLLSAGQFRGGGSGDGTQALFTRIGGRVLYGERPLERPTFTRVQATTVGSVGFVVEVTPADLVLVLYKPAAGDEWKRVLLAETAPGVWTGGVADDVREYFVQAVNGAAVSSARGKGLNFRPEPPVTATGFTIELNRDPDVGGWFTDDVTATVAPAPGSGTLSFEASVNGGSFAPVTGPIPLTTTGVNTLEVRASDGQRARAFVPIDKLPPDVVFGVPRTGQELRFGENVPSRFFCLDAGSGVASCDGPATVDTSVLGQRTFAVTAADLVGNVSTRTVTYSVIPRYAFEGFFPPVENAPALNAVRAGKTVPLKFRLREPDGTLVTEPSPAVKSIRVFTVTCPSSGALVVTVEEDAADSTAASGLRYDADNQQLVFNWKTSSTSASGSCSKVVVTTEDTVQHEAWFVFR